MKSSSPPGCWSISIITSDSGLPQVLAPDHNVHNRWHFHGPGVEFRGLSWADGLVKVPVEGFYMLRRELAFDGGTWPKGSLVQLGYTRNADPILFIAQVRGKLDENDLWFSDRGVGIPREQMSILELLSILPGAHRRRGPGGPRPVECPLRSVGRGRPGTLPTCPRTGAEK